MRDFSIEFFHKEYETDTSDLVVGDRRFSFFVPKSLDPFIDTEDLFRDFPLWSKIWEASMVLSQTLAQMPVEPEKRFLEIGCGIGLVGVVASSFGHRVIMTDFNLDALNFARANAVSNPFSKKACDDIARLDWNRPQLEGLFDYIVGSEVVYSKKDYGPILRLIKRYLRPSGEVILAEGMRKTSMGFFGRMTEHFDITAQKKRLSSEEKEAHIILARMKFK